MSVAESVPLHTRILEDIGSRIVHGEYSTGDVFRTEDLTGEYGASRTVVLHAVRGLELMGLITTKRRVGITVRDETKWMVYDPRIVRWRLSGPQQVEQLTNFIELRLCFEPYAARLCSQRASRETALELVRLADELHDAAWPLDHPNYPIINRVDADFHGCILESTDNYMMAALSPTTRAVIEGRMQYTTLPERADEGAVEAHGLLAQAILERDGDRAEELMRGLIEEIPRELGINSSHMRSSHPAVFTGPEATQPSR